MGGGDSKAAADDPLQTAQYTAPVMKTKQPLKHDRADWFIEKLEFITGIASTLSMDMQNDPRFFQDNVIDQRVAALAALGVVSALMVSSAMDEVHGMKKGYINFKTTDGIVQSIAFGLMCTILWANLLATYVAVAQSYHTFRLASTGPMGFEMAKAYYLNRNITNFRHLAIRSMLWSLPMYMFASCLRLLVKFDMEAPDAATGEVEVATVPVLHSSLHGIIWGAIFIIVGFFFLGIHNKHDSVFKERYMTIQKQAQDVMLHSQTIGATHGAPSSPDV